MIRPAISEDLVSLALLEKDSFRSEEAFSLRRIRYLMNTADSLVLVHEGRDVDGYLVLLFRRDTDSSRIYSLCVDPRRRREGIGGQLVRSAEAASAERGCRRVRLEVRAGAEETVKFYGHLGFRVVRRLPDYYGNGLHGFRMEKALSPNGG